VLHKDLRSYGFKERLYTKAREMGVIFIRYADDRPPRLETIDGRLQLAVWEPSLGEEMKLTPELLALATATIPTSNAKDLGLAFKVPITQEGFFLEAHVKLRPVDFASEGIFLCGSAHYPKFIDETVAQAMAAAARASTILAKDYLEAGGAVSVVDPKKCVACLTCVRVCPYGVPRINADNVAEISMASCQGCGVCAGECPATSKTLSAPVNTSRCLSPTRTKRIRPAVGWLICRFSRLGDLTPETSASLASRDRGSLESWKASRSSPNS